MGDAILTAIYLINRMHSQVIDFNTTIESLKKSYPTTDNDNQSEAYVKDKSDDMIACRNTS